MPQFTTAEADYAERNPRPLVRDGQIDPVAVQLRCEELALLDGALLHPDFYRERVERMAAARLPAAVRDRYWQAVFLPQFDGERRP